MRRVAFLSSAIVAIGIPALPAIAGAEPESPVTAVSAIDAGRRLVIAGGCNDCHTPAFAESGARSPKSND